MCSSEVVLQQHSAVQPSSGLLNTFPCKSGNLDSEEVIIPQVKPKQNILKKEKTTIKENLSMGLGYQTAQNPDTTVWNTLLALMERRCNSHFQNFLVKCSKLSAPWEHKPQGNKENQTTTKRESLQEVTFRTSGKTELLPASWSGERILKAWGKLVHSAGWATNLTTALMLLSCIISLSFK